MKVIGAAQNSGYICTVSHEEIEKFLDLYYGNKQHLKIGDEIDLGKGYEWNVKIAIALETTKKFVETNRPIIESLMSGYSVLVDMVKREPTKEADHADGEGGTGA